MLSALFQGAAHLQNIHPLVVHYPVAFLSGASLLYFMAWVARRESWAWAGLWMLGLGALGAAAAAGSGLYAAPGVMLAISVKERLLVYHKWMMLSVLGLALLLAAWAVSARPMPARGRVAFMALLLLTTALMAVGADFGGRMVYDYNAGGNACSQPIEFSS